MAFSLFGYLDSVNCIAIADSMLNFGKFWTKNAITFDLTEIERKKRYLVSMKFCCTSNAAIKNVKIAKKSTFPKIFVTKLPFFRKVQIFKKNKIYFRILEVLPVILTTYLPV